MEQQPGSLRSTEIVNMIKRNSLKHNLRIVQLPSPPENYFLSDAVHLKNFEGVLYFNSILDKMNSF